MKLTPSLFRSELLGIFLRAYGRHWVYLGVAPLVAAIGAVLGLWQPWVLRVLLDEVFPGRQVGSLAFFVGSLIVVTAVRMIVDNCGTAVTQYGSLKILHDVRGEVLRRVLVLPLSVISRLGSTEVNNRVTGDVNAFGGILSEGISTIVRSSCTLVSSVAFLGWLDSRLLLACSAAIPLDILLMIYVRDRVFTSHKKAYAAGSRINAFTNEILLGVRTIRLLRMSQTVIDHLAGYQLGMRHAFKQAQVISVVTSLGKGIINQLPSIIVLGYGGLLVTRGSITAGVLMAFLQVIYLIFTPVEDILQLVMSSVKAKVHTERVDEIMGKRTAQVTPLSPAVRSWAPIRLDRVSFGYDQGMRILRSLSLEIPAGHTTVLLGRSGHGKSTLVKLILKVLTPDSGRIFLGEHELSEISEEQIHGHVALVDQDPVFFSCPISENLLLAAPNASEDKIRRVLWATCLDEFVQGLPKGLESELRDRGTVISGGELKRLALARAILMDPNILILDETTSGVDPHVENVILSRIREVLPGITLLLITHRATSVTSADRIVLLNSGEIIAAGTHSDLLGGCELYRQWCVSGSDSESAEDLDKRGERLTV